ncbi:Alpha/Beta hydrolase protein [Phyllosticta citrichinensis]|uniref:Alpha/Beta hydrolase protein n=1 Tax=Phyllosticta citrichinensis TaxID=1130410 RepID=A0ABR1XMQ5_9PEZI
MRNFALATVLASGASALTIPLLSSLTGFQNIPILSLSQGGKAQCYSGLVAVQVTTTGNTQLNFNLPANQSAVTDIFTQYLTSTSTLVQSLTGPDASVSGTFNIHAKLCFPLLSLPPLATPPTVQFLIHGIGFDKSYWDFAPGYSQVDAAAAAGYATFTYDRLGVGQSDHPDAIQVVQSPLEVDIAHALIQMLRGGALLGTKFSKVAIGGHSFGSIQSIGIASRYPADIDAVMLTGFGLSASAFGLTFAGFNAALANKNQPARFGALSNGYLVTGSPQSNQLTFFKNPNYDAGLFAQDDNNKQTFTFGEFFTLGKVVAPATAFKGPVDVVIGQNDFIFCQGDCMSPSDQTAPVAGALFPAAGGKSDTFILPGAGHALNVHYGASRVFAHMNNFLKNNGL